MFYPYFIYNQMLNKIKLMSGEDLLTNLQTRRWGESYLHHNSTGKSYFICFYCNISLQLIVELRFIGSVLICPVKSQYLKSGGDKLSSRLLTYRLRCLQFKFGLNRIFGSEVPNRTAASVTSIKVPGDRSLPRPPAGEPRRAHVVGAADKRVTSQGHRLTRVWRSCSRLWASRPRRR